MAVPIFDEERFKELVIYIASQCKGDPAFGMVKLNKLCSSLTSLHTPGLRNPSLEQNILSSRTGRLPS